MPRGWRKQQDKAEITQSHARHVMPSYLIGGRYIIIRILISYGTFSTIQWPNIRKNELVYVNLQP